jgi:1-deoxy-D-xylulose-5-phosphate reductoisomerase
MNKGLEVIEARWLFDAPPEQVEVVVHPQSIVHSLVEFRDGSVLAQLGLPDMRVPIAVALAHPERLPLDLPRLDLAALARLEFEDPDRKRFPCLDLAYQALRGAEAAPAVLNAANEMAVAAFLAGRIPFPAIAAINGAVLEAFEGRGGPQTLAGLGDVLEADRWARACAGDWLGREEARRA